MFPLAPEGPSTPATPCEGQVRKDPCYLISIYFIEEIISQIRVIQVVVRTGDPRGPAEPRGPSKPRGPCEEWEAVVYIRCSEQWWIIFRGQSRPLVDAFVKQRSDIRELRGSCCNMLEFHMFGISLWNQTNSSLTLSPDNPLGPISPSSPWGKRKTEVRIFIGGVLCLNLCNFNK